MATLTVPNLQTQDHNACVAVDFFRAPVTGTLTR